MHIESRTHPMPEGSEGNTKILTLDGSGQLEIGRITFDRTGVYTYTLKELGGCKKHCIVQCRGVRDRCNLYHGKTGLGQWTCRI